MCEYFYFDNYFLGFYYFCFVFKGDYKEVKYFYGVFYMVLGMIEKGKKIFMKLIEDDGFDFVEMSWENVQEFVSQFNVRMKDVYVDLYMSM